MELLHVERIEMLLLVAAVVAMLARRLRLPYTVGLTLAGLGLAVFPSAVDLRLTKELIFTAFLPPLIFEAAFHIHWRELRRDMAVVMVLATLGVLLAAAVTAGGLYLIAGWEWPAALLLGVLISATDPVSVIATFKEAGVKGRLRLLVEAESLFNDGVVAVLFAVALAATTGGSVGAGGVAWSFVATMLGGVLCGGLMAGGLLLLAWRTTDHLVEITFTTVAAYGSFVLAEHFHLSGVLATMTAGLVIGNTGALGAISDRGREAVESFWEYVGFVANSLIFLLIGISTGVEKLSAVWQAAVIVIALVTVGRAVAVYACCALFAGSRLRVSMAHQHVLFWGGLRGALALALALGLPATVPHHDAIVSVCFAVVAFSVIAQGVTMTPLLRKLGEVPAPVPREAQQPV
ncbi:MAG TPA: sodium:proton antiporter [Longimicrobiaceae bacterium]|jgi:CPA1 family monovalent cation:H+ antiporter|nr:sodium:proton antiporter [Longimicrobiaceae bacterium]